MLLLLYLAPVFYMCDILIVLNIWAPFFIGFGLERFDYTLHSSIVAVTVCGRSAREQVTLLELRGSSLHMHSSASLSLTMKMHHMPALFCTGKDLSVH
jgi:hypothetical protein